MSLVRWYRLLTRMHLFQIDFQLVSGKINAKNTWVLQDYMHSQSQPLEHAANVTYWYHMGLVPSSILLTYCMLAALYNLDLFWKYMWSNITSFYRKLGTLNILHRLCMSAQKFQFQVTCNLFSNSAVTLPGVQQHSYFAWFIRYLHSCMS